jgi:acyl-CoA reductase-like NAD-dependent aldehyde dehydrogenase
VRRDDEGIRITNDSKYALSSAVSGASLDRVLTVDRRIPTGTVPDKGGFSFGPDSAFGDNRPSGPGREHGVGGLEGYLETQPLALPAVKTAS